MTCTRHTLRFQVLVRLWGYLVSRHRHLREKPGLQSLHSSLSFATWGGWGWGEGGFPVELRRALYTSLMVAGAGTKNKTDTHGEPAGVEAASAGAACPLRGRGDGDQRAGEGWGRCSNQLGRPPEGVAPLPSEVTRSASVWQPRLPLAARCNGTGADAGGANQTRDVQWGLGQGQTSSGLAYPSDLSTRDGSRHNSVSGCVKVCRLTGSGERRLLRQAMATHTSRHPTLTPTAKTTTMIRMSMTGARRRPRPPSARLPRGRTGLAYASPPSTASSPNQSAG
mmetsp:Transcript_51725/g.92235  ORF Transcript_51725/g.92235 Transcript_51725/m.92235 type:complete len:281 (+) Transcript_51725:496-1338(+)